MTIVIVDENNVIVYDPSDCGNAVDYLLQENNENLSIAVSLDNENWFGFIGPHPKLPPTR